MQGFYGEFETNPREICAILQKNNFAANIQESFIISFFYEIKKVFRNKNQEHHQKEHKNHKQLNKVELNKYNS